MYIYIYIYIIFNIIHNIIYMCISNIYKQYYAKRKSMKVYKCFFYQYSQFHVLTALFT